MAEGLFYYKPRLCNSNNKVFFLSLLVLSFIKSSSLTESRFFIKEFDHVGLGWSAHTYTVYTVLLVRCRLLLVPSQIADI
jgi:hypothetical protein